MTPLVDGGGTKAPAVEANAGKTMNIINPTSKPPAARKPLIRILETRHRLLIAETPLLENA